MLVGYRLLLLCLERLPRSDLEIAQHLILYLVIYFAPPKQGLISETPLPGCLAPG